MPTGEAQRQEEGSGSGRGREAREPGSSGDRSDRLAAVRSVGRLPGDARLLGRNTEAPVSENCQYWKPGLR